MPSKLINTNLFLNIVILVLPKIPRFHPPIIYLVSP